MYTRCGIEQVDRKRGMGGGGAKRVVMHLHADIGIHFL